jgi:transposase
MRNTVPTPVSRSLAIRRTPRLAAKALLMAATLEASLSSSRRRPRLIPCYVPLSFAPGEAYQFDWSHEVVLLSGVTVTVKVAHVRLCHSRMLFVRAYPRETQEMVFDAHDRAFALFKGTCQRGIDFRRRIEASRRQVMAKTQYSYLD